MVGLKKKMTNSPVYAYSFPPDNPSFCYLLCSTAEVDAWEVVGTLDRQIAQLVVTSLNHATNERTRNTNQTQELS
jgi:hypothetical protein